MPTKRDPPPSTRDGSAGLVPPPAERELILVAQPGADTGVAAADGRESAALNDLLATAGASIRPLFDTAPGRGMRGAVDELMAGADAPTTRDLASYFRVDAPDDQLDRLAGRLRQLPSVQAAYVKPPTYPAVTTRTPPSGAVAESPTTTEAEALNLMLPDAADAPPVTPDFASRQLYLGAAPAGIDALFAQTQPGGRGTGVRIIDIEGAWRFTHEDLGQNQGGIVAGVPSTDLGWRNHGTAVVGVIGGDRNSFGITGICPDAHVRAISIFGGLGSAAAIRQAADLLGPGDIILIELHRPGPRATGVGQVGFIAIEWWPDDFDAIRYATSRGVVVVEAAGNGAQNLDDPIYDVPAPGFPSAWRNPFRRGTRDSGAVLVGAGAPPPGTHGRDHGPDRSRLDFSNFGAAVDAQGWGREVTTTGYGDLQGGLNEDFWYTDQFSGTSSASPIVVGALGCVQGNRRARGLAPLAPAAARSVLRSSGSPQQSAPARPSTQRIGNRPNLRQLITVPVALTIPLFRYWNPQNTDHFYTTNWAELGGGAHGYGFEGIQCYVAGQPAPGMQPLYRYWNAAIGDHFYTTNWGELGAGRYGWGFEGIQCHVYPSGGAGRAALYRYWNPTIGDHFYTTNWGELGPGAHGWRFEGIQCYVATTIRPPEAPMADGEGQAEPSTDAPPPLDGPAPMTPFDATASGATSSVPASFLTAAGASSQESVTPVMGTPVPPTAGSTGTASFELAAAHLADTARPHLPGVRSITIAFTGG